MTIAVQPAGVLGEGTSPEPDRIEPSDHARMSLDVVFEVVDVPGPEVVPGDQVGRPGGSGRDPADAAPLARALAVSELLVIDLARVGSGSGPPLDAVAELAAALPDIAIYAGGGVRNDEDLRALESAGAAGALVATAVHEGRITP